MDWVCNLLYGLLGFLAGMGVRDLAEDVCRRMKQLGTAGTKRTGG